MKRGTPFLQTLVTAVATLATTACGAADAASPLVEVIYHNGNFVTANDAFDLVEAIAVRGGTIVATGDDAEILALANDETRTVDLMGKTVLPGLSDSHVHLRFGEAEMPGRLDLRHVQDVPELKEALRETAEGLPAGQWIVADISEPSFPEPKLPTRADLDEVSTEHPIALPRGHVWVLNSRALREASIDASTPEPEGGTIARDANGELTGILRENPAQRLVERVIPPRPELDDEAAERNLYELLRELVRYGITSGNVAGLRVGSDFRRVQSTYERWGHELPRMTLQLRLYPGYDEHEDVEVGARQAISEIDGLSFRTGFGDDRLKIGAIKMSVDGGMTGHAAHMLEPYPDGRHGVTRIPRETLYRVAKHAHDLGWQLGIHAIGDGGVVMAVDVLDQILRENPRSDARHYLHHVSLRPPEETIERMAANDLIVSTNPNFTYDLAPFYTSATSGDRLATNNPQRSLAEAGVPLAYGSDGRPYGPLVGIWAAVTREGRDGEFYAVEEEGVSVQDAIRFSTRGGAFLTFDEETRGTLEPGKVADMVVLTENILTVEPSEIRHIGIEQTIISGEVVYTATEPLTARFGDRTIWKARRGGAE